jgi:uncharacterized repeat protein (TIGR03803 family)
MKLRHGGGGGGGRWAHGAGMGTRAAAVEGLERRVLFAVADTILHDFAGRPGDGSIPIEGLVLIGSKLYGATQFGGAHDDGSGGTTSPGLGHKGGTIFSVNTDGSGYQVLHQFGGTVTGGALDGYEPLSQLTVFNGKLYGTTPFGGPGGVGTVFSINADGSGYTTIHAFGDNNPVAGSSATEFDDGASPFAGLTVVGNKLYGITNVGGRPVGTAPDIGAGVLFSINPDGSNYTKVHVFDTGTNVATYNLGVVSDGTTFYGVTSAGGPANAGRIYAVGVDGSNFRILHDLNGTTDGRSPNNELTLVNNTTLAGVAINGGDNGVGTMFTMNVDGSNFQARHSFSSFVDGNFPHGELLQVGDKLYGTTTSGGPGFSATFAPIGVVFSTNLDGTGFEIVHAFNGLVVNGKKGASNIYGQLATDGTNLYGVSGNGGVNDIGTIWSTPLGAGTNPQLPAITVSLAGVPVTNGQSTIIDFGTVARGQASKPQKVFTVTNTGGAALTLSAPQLPAGYTLVEPLAASLAPGASDTFTVALNTATAGTFAGPVQIANNDGGIVNNRFQFPVTGRVTGSGTGGGGTADLTVQVSGRLPASAIGGTTKGTLRVKVTNSGGGTTAGNSTVQLLLSADDLPDAGDTVLATVPLTNLRLRARQSRTVAASFTFPASVASGVYRVLAVADPGGTIAESNESNNTAPAGQVTVAPPSVNLSGTARAVSARVGRPATLSLTLRNTGSTNATRLSTPLRVVLSRDGVFDGVGETILLDTVQSLTIPAGRTRAVVLRLPAIAGPAGTFALQTLIDPGAVTPDAVRTDNTIPGTIRLT